MSRANLSLKTSAGCSRGALPLSEVPRAARRSAQEGATLYAEERPTLAPGPPGLSTRLDDAL